MPSCQLKELEAGDLIVRREYPQVLPKVGYRLSERGSTLMGVLHELCTWGLHHMNDAWAVPLPEDPSGKVPVQSSRFPQYGQKCCGWRFFSICWAKPAEMMPEGMATRLTPSRAMIPLMTRPAAVIG